MLAAMVEPQSGARLSMDPHSPSASCVQGSFDQQRPVQIHLEAMVWIDVIKARLDVAVLTGEEAFREEHDSRGISGREVIRCSRPLSAAPSAQTDHFACHAGCIAHAALV
jgi:hypothetical protein